MKKETSAGIAIVFDGRVLLAHATGRKWNAGYGIPKGHLEKGESPLDAAIRETYEEVGIKVDKNLIDKTEYTFIVSARKHNYIKTVYWYIAEIDSLKQIGLKDLKVSKNKLQLEEINWAGFMSLYEANKVVMKSQIPVIDTLRNKGLLENKHSLKTLLLFEQFNKK